MEQRIPVGRRKFQLLCMKLKSIQQASAICLEEEENLVRMCGYECLQSRTAIVALGGKENY